MTPSENPRDSAAAQPGSPGPATGDAAVAEGVPRLVSPLVAAGSLAVVSNAAHEVVTCTPALAELLGMKPEELHGSGLAAIALTINVSRGANGMQTGQVCLRCRVGPPVTLDFSVSPLRDGSGEAMDLAIFSVPARESRLPRDPREPEATATALAEPARDPASASALQLIEEDPNPVLRISRTGIVTYANRASWSLLAHWRTQSGGAVPADWAQAVRDALSRRETVEREMSVGFRTFLLFLVPIVDRAVVNVYGLDMTRRKRAEEKVRLSAQVFENVAQAIVVLDTDLRVISVNDAFCSATGFTQEEILGEILPDLDPEALQDGPGRGIAAAIRTGGRWQGELVGRRKNGDPYPQWFTLGPVVNPDGRITEYIAIFADISALKKTEEQLYTMAHYDSLTGLCNRRHFMDMLDGALRSARRTGELVGLLFVDVDSFKMVNDNLGHAAGDALLQEVANRLRRSVRETDTACRMGGDEFTILFPNLRTPESAQPLAHKILARVSQPLQIDGRELYITCSIGVALFSDTLPDAEKLLQAADTAMYHAKLLGKNNVQFFTPDLTAREDERLLLRATIRHALDAREFIVHYQPQYELTGRRLTGLEALARWQSPERGLVYPGAFIPAAERSGQICEIGEQILRAACRQAAEWRAKGLVTPRIGVNVSPPQLLRQDFVALVESVLRETGLPPGALELELTEGFLILDTRETRRTFDGLRSLGVSLAIDDFGTKYASLAYLKRLPVTCLKIDRSFIQDMTEGDSGRDIVGACIAMGRSMRLEVIAEGVETDAQLRLLEALGCPRVQGNLLGEPQAPDLIRPLLEEDSPEVIHAAG